MKIILGAVRYCRQTLPELLLPSPVAFPVGIAASAKLGGAYLHNADLITSGPEARVTRVTRSLRCRCSPNPTCPKADWLNQSLSLSYTTIHLRPSVFTRTLFAQFLIFPTLIKSVDGSCRRLHASKRRVDSNIVKNWALSIASIVGGRGEGKEFAIPAAR